ncbi:unnamed protein product [Malassezia sympodialis ATCC 42132]|uniref:uncharacterized protein n=1 Tax=Malassezia sympodialis (strain ATCC 42132) TaxID=1230383 RepID=UPI0002C23761|nr:uncharacterized protein MSY001_1258 [Malassezia sympodialis ATCC 42132]CCU98552.1 unnamed protein product [Malassezia sympodialis ATCC 42132]|eukprot:XP_018739852.1 uncharacterized protein MSY001_1258 [Malassezia sympodialis ATCC 42132]
MSKAGGKAAVATIVKLMVPAGKASAQPPVGPALGAKGVKAMDFAKEFNARTADLEPGLLTPTVVTIQPDRTFSFKTLRARKPGAEVTGTISIKHLCKVVAGSARSLGIKIVR